MPLIQYNQHLPVLKGLLHQNENFVINHLPSCRSKPVKALFVFGTQFKIFG